MNQLAIDLAPPTNGTDTSNAAAESMTENAATMRARAYRLISSRAMTCDEIERLTGWAHQSASARLWELARAGLIQDTGMRAKTRSGRTARLYAKTIPHRVEWTKEDDALEAADRELALRAERDLEDRA
jgi:DNA-binding transcriptional regulator GbsR (MarR family)